jgi:DNA-directed RNA polymerase beta' subunit
LGEAKTPADASNIIDEMTKQLQIYLEKKQSNIGVIGKAGGLKNGYNQARQILVSKGLISSPTGVKALQSSYTDGFDSNEFFESGYGSRNGIIDRVINTSDTGYLSRQLVYALQRVEGDPKVLDCKTKRFLTIKVTSDIAKRLKGRYVVNDDLKLEKFNSKKHLGKVIHLRSPLYCITPAICQACYGDMLLRNKTRYVGVLAGEICGERLTQTIMKTFHVGGAVSIKTIDIMGEISRILDSSEKKILDRSFKQEKAILKSLTDGEIVITFDDYLDPKKDILIDNKKVSLNYAYFKLKYSGIETDVTIDNKIEIELKDKVLTKEDSFIRIKYKSGDGVFECIPTNEAFSDQVKIIESLLS